MRYIALLVLILFVSCGKKKDTRAAEPADLIPENTMVQVLSDVHMQEATLRILSPGYGASRPTVMPPVKDPSITTAPVAAIMPADTILLYDVLGKYKFTRAQYRASMKWYCDHPDELNALYDDVIAELTRRQAADQFKPVKMKDSAK